MNRNIVELRNALLKLKPLHDNPIGLIHPYWARKPFNIVDTIITWLSRPGETILDPFMGSGTIVFSALSQNRSTFGSDLNPLSSFLVKAILELGLKPNSIDIFAEKFLAQLKEKVLPWYKLKNKNEYIERERFEVYGEYENGQFHLKRIEAITKTLCGKKWISRKKYTKCDDLVLEKKPNRNHLNKPINFEKIEMIPNSRIAIPKGAKLSHYYTELNRTVINYALCLTKEKDLSKSEKTFRKLLISSSLPLLRLSDKKASSQWPYWRPKKLLTSRNAVIVFENRIEAVKNMVNWVSEYIPNYSLIKKFPKLDGLSVSIGTCAIQDLQRRYLQKEKFNLILTDPPYSDQVPYLEYSDLWIKLLELGETSKLFNKEIVHSNSPIRLNDSLDYLRRLCKGFDACCHLALNNGHVVWFYQDYSLIHWCKINEIAKKNGMVMIDIIPISKQRRSFKTVTSPGCTLDGDLILIYKKRKLMRFNKSNKNINIVLSQLRLKVANFKSSTNLFEIYAMTIAHILKNDQVEVLSKHFPDVRELISHIIKEG